MTGDTHEKKDYFIMLIVNIGSKYICMFEY